MRDRTCETADLVSGKPNVLRSLCLSGRSIERSLDAADTSVCATTHRAGLSAGLAS